MPRLDVDGSQHSVERAAQERFAAREQDRHAHIETLQEPGGLARADTPERVAKRVDRLSRFVAGGRPPAPTAQEPAADPDVVIAQAVRRAAPTLGLHAGDERTDTIQGVAGVVLEKIINTTDYVGVRYLEAGMLAAQAVGRISIRHDDGQDAGFGTGSMVSPRLLLTNHHVLEDAAVAGRSIVEFDFEDGVDGQPRRPVAFELDPATFFMTDQACDFTLVAVAGDAAALGHYGHNPLIAAEGKAIIGDFVTIVQHPGGQKKQVALRENRVVDVFDAFLHYATDTEPGSSGSPVFNDQWEVIALHHASVPAPDHAELGGFLNEGIRVSRIMALAQTQNLTAAQHALLASVGERAAPEARRGPAAAAPLDGGDGGGARILQAARPPEAPGAAPGTPLGTLHVRIPLDVTIAIGGPAVDVGGVTVNGATAVPQGPAATERIAIDPDWAGRAGYRPGFLGPLVPLPTLPPALMARVARPDDAVGPDAHVLPYHHFSVVLDVERRLARFAAVNIDGDLSRRLKREADRWFFDPRVARDVQTGEDVYVHNDLDRGHLVRRLDPAWGATAQDAKRGNDDTFHFTNCTPQHQRFNQSKTTWAGLEDYILDNADNRDFKATIFAGPVLADDDDEYRGVQLPRQFWKVAVMVKSDGALSATGYVLSQEQLLQGLESTEDFDYGAYRTFQVPIARIERMTELSFGPLGAADPLAGQEATGPDVHPIDRLEDLTL